MIRILHVVNDMHRAGLETMLMNYYRNIDRNIIQFDFLTHRPYKSDYDDEIISMGGKVFYAPRLYPQNYHKYFKWMKVFFKEHPEYKIIHSHIDSMSFLPLLAAKKAGIPIRIAHSHNTSIDFDYKFFLKEFFRIMINKVANYRFACGDDAGRYLFRGKEFKYVPNAIDISKFIYNDDIRTKKREELGIKNQFVLGHIGRLSYQKNHKFLINVYKNFVKLFPKSLLILVGTGENENKIKKQIKKYGIEQNVLMLGNRADVNELYQAFDVFVLPSLFEGIPVVGIEAQCAGLPCIFSHKVPKQVKFTDQVEFIPLSKKLWCKKIVKFLSVTRNHVDMSNSDYNINIACNKLQNIYIELYKKKFI